MLIGGKSRAAVALYPEKTRFISLCNRRSSANGSKPNRGDSESAMVHLSAFTLVTHADGAWRGTQRKNLRRLTHQPVLPRTGDRRVRRWANNSDHILAPKRHDRGRPS